MKTTVLAAYGPDGYTLDGEAIARAAEVLAAGGLVAFPTETVYGLGANALDPEAVARLFEAKGRPPNNPVIVHTADAASAAALTSEWPEAADRLATAFWPGPLTVVVPKSRAVPAIVTAGGPNVALRVPAHPVALALLRASGLPIAAPSANRSERLSPTTAAHVLDGLAGRVDLIVDGGPTQVGIESTVVSLAGPIPLLLRPGLLAPQEIERITGPMLRGTSYIEPHRAADRHTDVASPCLKELSVQEPMPSPGMSARHYAPRAFLEVTTEGEARVRTLLDNGARVGWLAHSPAATSGLQSESLVRIDMPEDPAGYAARLYAALHELDDKGVTHIVADALPVSDEWLALRDRLSRATTTGA